MYVQNWCKCVVFFIFHKTQICCCLTHMLVRLHPIFSSVKLNGICFFVDVRREGGQSQGDLLQGLTEYSLGQGESQAKRFRVHTKKWTLFLFVCVRTNCINANACLCVFVCDQGLYMDAVQLFPEHLQEYVDLMTEKELRLRLPLEELDILLEDWTQRHTGN